MKLKQTLSNLILQNFAKVLGDQIRRHDLTYRQAVKVLTDYRHKLVAAGLARPIYTLTVFAYLSLC